MNRFMSGIAAVVLTVAVQAQPCPSIQWTAGQTVSADQHSINGLAAVDYDEDGKLDLVGTVQGNSSYTLVWWKGAGNNTFGVPSDIITDFSMTNIVIADATGDGRDDVLVGLYGAAKLLILPGTGSGRGPAIQTNLTVPPTWLFAINRDADPAVELVVSAAPSNQFAVYDNIATTMTVVATVTTAPIPKGIVSADFDADGHLDVAVGSRIQQDVSIYYGKADGSYDAPVSLGGVNPWEVRVADLDEDGRPDLVAGNWESDGSGQPGTVSVYMNEGLRTFSSSIFSIDKPGMQGDTIPVLLADVSGDGHVDLVAGAGNGAWTTTATGRGDGTFRTPTYLYTPEIPGGPMSYAAADFDADGKIDLAIGSNFSGLTLTSRTCATQTNLYSVSPVISNGQQATLHAYVSGFGSDTPAPFGTVTLRDGATVLDTPALGIDGHAAFTLSALALGDHPMTAEFSGNPALAAATSPIVVQKVTNETTQVTIELPASPAVYGQPFPIQITIVNGSIDYVTVDIDGVKFQHYTGGPLNRVLEPGSHTISAKYLGSIFKPPSESAPVTFSVAKGAPAVGVTGALAVRSGTSHSLTVTVTGSGATAPGGSVQLREGAAVVATSALVNGTVTFNTPFTRGAHDVSLVYLGDARYLTGTQNVTLEVLPNQPLVIEARGLAAGVHIAYLVPANTDMNSLQLFRRPAGTAPWTAVPAWSQVTGMDPTALTRGVTYEYQLNAAPTGGAPAGSNVDSALLFNDDLLAAGIRIKRAHFGELRLAVNLLRTQGGLSAFEFEPGYNTSAIVRASHLTGLRTALTQARQQLGMTAPSFTTVTIGTTIRASQIQELRELAR
jgi:hypothetical protein